MEDLNGMGAFNINFDNISPFGEPVDDIIMDGDGTTGPEIIDNNAPTDEPIIDPDDANQNNEIDNNAAEDEDPEDVGSEDVDKEGSADDSGSSSNLYSSLAAVLSEQDLLPSINLQDTEVKDINDFVEIMRKEQTAQAQLMLDDYIKNLDIKKLAESNSILTEISNMDESYFKDNIEQAKEVIRQEYKSQGLTDGQIGRLIDKYVDLGEEDLINEALSAVGNLKQIETARIEKERKDYELQKEANIKQQAELQEKLKQSVFDSDGLIKGYKPTPALKSQVYKAMTDIVGYDEQGNPENKFLEDRRKDPVGFESRMYYFYTLTNGFKDMGNIATTSKSGAVNNLETALRGFVDKNNNGKPSFMNDQESYFGSNGSSNFTLNI